MSDQVLIPTEVLEDAKDLPLPSYTTLGAAGVDLRAASSTTMEPLGCLTCWLRGASTFWIGVSA